MASLKMSAAGLASLIKDEGSIDGLYDDPSGYCTFGVGHLVHPTDKWSCFLLAAARTNEAWKGKLMKMLSVVNLPRSVVGWGDWADVKTKAVELGIGTVGMKKHGKDLAKLTEGEKTAAKGVAEAAVKIEENLLIRTVSAVLSDDLGSYESAANSAITGLSLTQDEFDALVSLAFNIGVANLKSSQLVKTINKNEYRSGTDVKARETAITEVEKAFASWNKSGGIVLTGLTKRRQSESDRFLKGARGEVVDMKLKAATGKK